MVIISAERPFIYAGGRADEKGFSNSEGIEIKRTSDTEIQGKPPTIIQLGVEGCVKLIQGAS
jgi:hypothetical protein